MHDGLTRLYSHPSSMEPVDLQSLGLEDDPSVPKCSREMELAGGRHVGDFRVNSQAAPGNAFRKYLLREERTAVSVIFMNRAKTVSVFPARPLVSCKTRFKDGHRHATLTGKGDRKLRMPGWTATRLRQGTLDDILTAHRAAVRKLVAEGHEALEPPSDPAALIALERADTDESRAFYQSRSPYSWGDAVHWAFNLTRREYRPVVPLPSRERSDADEE